MVSPLPLNECCSSTFPSLWICAVVVQPCFPELRLQIFFAFINERGAGTDHESGEKNKTSSSNYSFPLKGIPQEHWKPRHDPVLAEKAALQQPTVTSRVKGQQSAWSRSWRQTKGQLHWAGIPVASATLTEINWWFFFFHFKWPTPMNF